MRNLFPGEDKYIIAQIVLIAKILQAYHNNQLLVNVLNINSRCKHFKKIFFHQINQCGKTNNNLMRRNNKKPKIL